MKKKYFLVILTLFALILFGYWDVLFHPRAYYDDIGNIFNLTVATKRFDFETVRKVLTFSYGGFRPVSYFSFYLNYLFWGNGIENLTPFIVTNVLLHFFNSILVFFISLKLTKKDFSLSLLVSLAWALTPANALAVDYLVQRMTELMFFFGMLSFLSFINFVEKKSFKHLVFSFFFFLFSLFSKENAVLLLPLFFVYLVWFDYVKVDVKKLYVLFILVFVLFVVFTANYFLPLAIKRGFTPYQRLLTESRVLVYYLKVLLIPFPSDIFLYLEFPFPNSVLLYLSTLFSILILIILFLSSFYLYGKNRLASFGILGFFLFHVVESTTIPLYTAFLHRNYVPSFFLYLALFSILFSIIKKKEFVFLLSFLMIANFLFVLKIHNAKYTSPFFYLSENYKNFPENKDLCLALGSKFAARGLYKKAVDMYLKSFKPDKVDKSVELILNAFLNLKKYNEVIQLGKNYDSIEINRIVGNAYKKLGNYKMAETYFKKSLEKGFNNQVFFAYLDLLARQRRFEDILLLIKKYEDKAEQNELLTMYKINSYIELGLFNKAEPLFNSLKTENIKHWLKGKYLLAKGDTDGGISELNKVKIKMFSPLNVFIELQKVLLLSEGYMAKGECEKALQILEKYRKKGFFVSVIETQLTKVRKRIKDGKCFKK